MVAVLFLWDLICPGVAVAAHLAIDLDTLGEAPPAQLCVLSAGITGQKEAEWQKKFGARPPNRQQEDPKHCYRSVTSWGEEERMLCTREAEGRVLIMRVADVGIDKVELAGSVAHLEIRIARNELLAGSTGKISVAGGHYWERQSVPFPTNNQNYWARVQLVPRCVERWLSFPQFECGEEQAREPISFSDSAGGPLVPSTPCPLDRSGARAFCTVPIAETGATIISAKACGHELEATTALPLPAAQVELGVSRFWFEWRRHCLSPKDSCPDVAWLMDRVSCASTIPGEGACRFNGCSGKIRFPAKIRLRHKGRSANQFWDETLGYPGQVLQGFTPEERRRVALNWQWPEVDPSDEALWKSGGRACQACRTESSSCEEPRTPCLMRSTHCRACPSLLDALRVRREEAGKLSGGEIDYLEVRTPEGREHRVGLETNQIRIPELDCEDRITVTYQGRLDYRLEHLPYQSSSEGIAVPAPEDLRKTRMVPAVAVAAGLRGLRSGRGRFGPAGELDAIFGARTGFATKPNLKPELRLGVLLASSPYCYEMLSNKPNQESSRNSHACEGTMDSVLVWRLFAELGLTLYRPSSPWRFGGSLGGGLSYVVFERDDRKSPLDWLVTLRGEVGYELIRGLTAGMQVRGLFPNEVYETVFDESGVVRHGHNGARWDTDKLGGTIGAVIRVDDPF